jgi:hypothetical protein
VMPGLTRARSSHHGSGRVATRAARPRGPTRLARPRLRDPNPPADARAICMTINRRRTRSGRPQRRSRWIMRWRAPCRSRTDCPDSDFCRARTVGAPATESTVRERGSRSKRTRERALTSTKVLQ